MKIYYDNGQEIVAHALRGAVEYALSKESVLFRKTNAADFMLAQAADMLCALELTAENYRNKEATRTDIKMFGNAHAFKNNYMKQSSVNGLVNALRLWWIIEVSPKSRTAMDRRPNKEADHHISFA